MNGLDLQPGHPLRWPDGRPRTAADQRAPARWRNGGSALTLTIGRKRLVDQLDAMTARGQSYRTTNLILSTNIRYTASGARDQNVSRRDPADPGVALYFDLDRRAHVLACDRWDTVQDNIAAIAAHVEALRGQERWGVADLRQAFAGHVALPAPRSREWWRVLGLSGSVVSRHVVDVAYRRRAATAHPDAGGTREEWDELTAAYEAAKQEVGR